MHMSRGPIAVARARPRRPSGASWPALDGMPHRCPCTRATSTLLRRARRARRIRSGRARGDPGASGRAAIAARARAPAISDPARARAGSVDQSRARRRAAAADLKVLIMIIRTDGLPVRSVAAAHGRSVQPGFWNNYVQKCVLSGGTPPIDLAAAWPADRVRLRLEISRS
jgi:hypothetical protein